MAIEHSDQELVLLSRFDPEAFAGIVLRYSEKLKRYIHRLSRVSHEEAEDIAQEIFIKAYTHLNEYDDALSFSSWMYRIAHNEVISQFRKRRARGLDEQYDLDNEAVQRLMSDISPAHDVDDMLRKEFVSRLLDQLPEKYRSVLVLRYLEDKSYEDISDILQKSPGTIATLLNRAKKMCATQIQRL